MAILTWNGVDLPEELRGLPPGRYMLATAEAAPALTAEQEAGLALALQSVEREEILAHEQVLDRVGKILRR